MIDSVVAVGKYVKDRVQCFFGFHRWRYGYRQLNGADDSEIEAHCQRCPYWEVRSVKEAVRSYRQYGHVVFYDVDGRTIGADPRQDREQ